MTALLLAAVMAAPIAHADSRHCNKLFTVWMDQRAANAIYHGTRKVTSKQLRLLDRLERCQRNPQARPFVHSYNHRQKSAHTRRIIAARIPPMPYYVLASWFYDGGATACGFHATYGVANKTLPCGYRVQLRHGGNSVEAIVEDRGPFIYGRTFDLNPNTKAALGCSDLCVVQASATG